MPDFVRVDIDKFRKDRQSFNNDMVFQHIFNDKKPIEDSNHVNVEALKKVYEYLGKEIVIAKSIEDDNFAKLLSMFISKKASRQGSLDEALVIETIKKFMKTLDIDFEKSKTNDLVPIKSGQFAGQLLERKDVEKNNIPKTDCLKSIDCLVIDNTIIIGYGTLKVCFGSGGHQDNVVDELGYFVEWAIKYGKEDKLYLVVIDSDQVSTTDIKNKSASYENIWVVDHYEFQVKFYDWWSKRQKV